MTIWQLIRTMVQRGFEFHLSRHEAGLRGYYAWFIKPNEPLLIRWELCGHGITPYRAVLMAARIALNLNPTIPPKSEFEI